MAEVINSPSRFIAIARELARSGLSDEQASQKLAERIKADPALWQDIIRDKKSLSEILEAVARLDPDLFERID
jgi:hypothetical protein